MCARIGEHDRIPIVIDEKGLAGLGLLQVRSAIDQVMLEKHAGIGMESLLSSGVIEHLMPEVKEIVGFGGYGTGHKNLWEHTKQVVEQAPHRVRLKWAALFHDVGKPRSIRRAGGEVSFHNHEMKSASMFRDMAFRSGLFNDDRREADIIVRLIENLGYVEGYDSSWTDSAVRRFGNFAGDLLDDLIDLAKSDVTSKHADRRQRAQNRADELRQRVLHLRKIDARPKALPKGLGNVLIEQLCIDRGPELGRIMDVLRARVELGDLPAGEDDVSVYVEAAREAMKG